MGSESTYDEFPHRRDEKRALHVTAAIRFVGLYHNAWMPGWKTDMLELKTPGDWRKIVEQKSMFCNLGLSRDQVLRLRRMCAMRSPDD
jgi:hypothetical protein